MIIEYQEVGGMLIPNLASPQDEPTELGPFAARRLRWLREERPILHAELLASGKLEEHLAEIERSATQMMDALVSRSARAQGVDEAMKRDRRREWVQAMGEIQARATSAVMRELILA